MLLHAAPDGQRADIHHGDEHQHLIAGLGHAALDDHAVDIGAGALRADIRKRDQQQAQQREAGAAEVGEHAGGVALVHAGAHEHRQRHHAAGGDEKRRDHAIGPRCAPVAAALGLGQTRQHQRLRRPGECERHVALGRDHERLQRRHVRIQLRFDRHDLAQRHGREAQHDDDRTDRQQRRDQKAVRPLDDIRPAKSDERAEHDAQAAQYRVPDGRVEHEAELRRKVDHRRGKQARRNCIPAKVCHADDRGQQSDTTPPQHRAQPDPQIDAVARGKDHGQTLDEHPDDIEAENVDEHSAKREILRNIRTLRIAPRGDSKAARGQKQIPEGILPVALEHGHNARDGLLPDIAFFVCHGSASQHAGHDQHQTGRHAGDDDAVIDPGHLLGELVGIGLHDLQPPLGLLVDQLFNAPLLGLCLLFQANASS